jgi:acetyl esterase/lipase
MFPAMRFPARVFTLLLCSTAALANDLDVEVRDNIVYGTGGGRDLTFNLAKPKDVNGPLPVVVMIHGGGWAGGNKDVHNSHIRDFAQRGYASITVGYRLVPEARFPAQVEDCKCAVRYLRAHADDLGIDSERIGAIGFSAGAHLSMILGTMDNGDGLEGDGGWADQSSKVQAVVAYFGPTDFTLEYPEESRRIVKEFLDGTMAEKPDVYRRASPITYVNAGDAPLLIFQGTRDRLVPHEQAIVMIDRLSQAGVPGRVEILLGADHGWGGHELEHTVNATYEFFADHLHPNNQ